MNNDNTMKNQANNSFHNTCILRHTAVDLLTPKLNVIQSDRIATDDCGNITAIDGKKVVGGNMVYRLDNK
jgi:hypothetical protein